MINIENHVLWGSIFHVEILERDANLFVLKSDEVVLTDGFVWVVAGVARRDESAELHAGTSVCEGTFLGRGRGAGNRIVYI